MSKIIPSSICANRYINIGDVKIHTIERINGGKSRLQKYIQPLIKPHRVWIDCTWGAGSTSINKKPSEYEIGCDLNPRVIRFNKAIQGNYREVSDWISSLDYSRDTFDWAEDWKEIGDDIEFATKFLVRNRLSFDGNLKQYTFSNRLRRGVPEFLSVWEQMPARIIKFGQRIQNFYFFVADVERSINLVRDIPDSFLLVDLPYKMSGERTTGGLYEIDTLDSTHTRMLDALQGIKGSGAVCHYRDNEYEQKLYHWSYKEIKVKINKGSNDRKNGRIECVWWK